MLGRVLFTFVWLIIAAGLVLPVYPGDEVISVVTAGSAPVQPVAANEALTCEDCPVADDDVGCRTDCRCDQVVSAVFVPLEEGAAVTITTFVRPRAKVPAKLPAI